MFYHPSTDSIEVLGGKTWVVTYSGGKDSTSLVMWIEWLRRSGQIKCQPRLVHSNTEVEYPFLEETTQNMMNCLRRSGWECTEVRPKLQDKLYNQIFGRGLPPVHPGIRAMRWCTRSTKVDPMKIFAKSLGKEITMVIGVRWGESSIRDSKLAALGCAAGGECGMPRPEANTFSPIVSWTTCQVVDWLQGYVSTQVSNKITDLVEISKTLLKVYGVKINNRTGLFEGEPIISTLRYGCIGCPAISQDKTAESHLLTHPEWKHLRRLYWIWEHLRSGPERLGKNRKKGWVLGPIRMAARKKYFTELLKIQKDSGVELVTKTDIAFIKDCWKRNVYPRGWSAKDEQNRIDIQF